MTKKVVMISFWKNDADRFIEERARHLLAKTYPNLRWMWSVGDCVDDTLDRLRFLAEGADVQFVDSTTNIPGSAMNVRYLRLSKMATMTFRHIRDDDELALVHESDIESPPDVIEQLLQSGKIPIAGWPIIKLGGHTLFYDTWAYHRYGQCFSNKAPYHFCYLDRDDDVFEVDGFGTVYMMPAQSIRNMEIREEAVREICENLKSAGMSLWCDSRVIVQQPRRTVEFHHNAPPLKPRRK